LALLRNHSLRWAVPLALLVLLLATYRLWLRGLGEYLVKGQEPFHADLIVVLGGDDRGYRILKAAELVKQGFASKVLVSAPYCCYGHVESDLAIPFAVRHGYPEDWFIPFPIQGTSTATEAQEVLRELDRRRVGRFLVVTSNYHTRRAGRIYRKLVPADRFRMIAAPAWKFTPDSWWTEREGEKLLFLEWSKTVASWAGL
jgi:uncharacterized SAM-binding protein YcdF (DUF218 family)